MKRTQYRMILDHLKAHGKATTWELMMVSHSTCPHARIAEMTHHDGRLVYPYGVGRITRTPVVRNGRRVTEYRLIR